MKLKDDFITQDIEDKQFLVAVGAEAFNGVVMSNATAAFIVDQLKQEVTIDEIVNVMYKEYNAPKSQIRTDVERIIETLRSINAIEE